MLSNEFSCFTDRTVLVTGGTGTFGRSFVSQLLRASAVKKIIVFSRDEFKQHEMCRDLRDDSRVRFFIGDVRDRERLQRAFEEVDIVVHAAALKQVPAVEYNPLEAVKTNVLGTQNVIDAALDNNVDKVLLISSDKAVQPINLYGATKLCAEKLFVAANAYRGDKRRTKFSVARYGNVLGSRGSLVETIARERIKGTLTLTDDRMTRFWITVDQVMGVIAECFDHMVGGEIFVPKMKALRVRDVISYLAPECTLTVTGMRPGEKLHEILVTDYEARRTRDAGSMYVITPEFGGGDYAWLQDKPLLSSNFVYDSSHPHFLLSDVRAAGVFHHDSVLAPNHIS